MKNPYQRPAVINHFRRYPRVRTRVPFSCSLSRVDSLDRRWFTKHAEGVGVVYDVSLRGIRVSTEAVIKPGDLVALTLQLPKQIMPATITVATVRWAKDQVYGLAFRRLSQSSLNRLSKYMTTMAMSVGKNGRRQYGTDRQFANR